MASKKDQSIAAAGTDLKFLAYYRVSTQRQGHSGLGLEAQQTEVAKFLSRQGSHVLLEEFTEVESGTRKGNDRPHLKAALEFAAQAKATLVIAKLDRLARNVHFISGLMESKVDFIALDLPDANRLMLHIMAAFAEHEAQCISERTKAAIRHHPKYLAGKWGNPQNLTPQYSALSREKAAEARRKDAILFADKMRPTLSFYLQNRYSLHKIAAEMNRLQFATPSGLIGKWTATTVKNCLAWVA